MDSDPLEGVSRSFFFTIPQTLGYFYISLESYFKNTIPQVADCFGDDQTSFSPQYSIQLLQNGELVQSYQNLFFSYDLYLSLYDDKEYN